MKQFRTYQLAGEFYKECTALKLPYHLKLQLHRAASSVVLNLVEGAAKSSLREQHRFFETAYGSIRESKAILLLVDSAAPQLHQLADSVAASTFRLMKSTLKR